MVGISSLPSNAGDKKKKTKPTKSPELEIVDAVRDAAKVNCKKSVVANNKLLKMLYEMGIYVTTRIDKKNYYMIMTYKMGRRVVIIERKMEGNLLILVCDMAEDIIKRYKKDTKVP